MEGWGTHCGTMRRRLRTWIPAEVENNEVRMKKILRLATVSVGWTVNKRNKRTTWNTKQGRGGNFYTTPKLNNARKIQQNRQFRHEALTIDAASDRKSFNSILSCFIIIHLIVEITITNLQWIGKQWAIAPECWANGFILWWNKRWERWMSTQNYSMRRWNLDKTLKQKSSWIASFCWN